MKQPAGPRASFFYRDIADVEGIYSVLQEAIHFDVGDLSYCLGHVFILSYQVLARRHVGRRRIAQILRYSFRLFEITSDPQLPGIQRFIGRKLTLRHGRS